MAQDEKMPRLPTPSESASRLRTMYQKKGWPTELADTRTAILILSHSINAVANAVTVLAKDGKGAKFDGFIAEAREGIEVAARISVGLTADTGVSGDE